MQVQPLRRTRHPSSARAQTYELLRDLIVSLQLKPRERLSDVAWATELGVSRTPVREALLQLADEELVDVIPQLGTFVSPISVAAVREAQFIRAALELAALPVAVARLTDAELTALAANVAAQRDAHAAQAPTRFYELDEAFHRQIMSTTGFPGVWRTAERSRAHLDRVRRLSLPDPAVIAELVLQHAGILEALRQRDVGAAEVGMREHLGLVLRGLPALVEQHPDFFVDEQRGAPAPASTGVSAESM